MPIGIAILQLWGILWGVFLNIERSGFLHRGLEGINCALLGRLPDV